MVCTFIILVSSSMLALSHSLQRPLHERTSSLPHFALLILHALRSGKSLEQPSIGHRWFALSWTNTYMMIVALAYEDIVPPNVTTEIECLSKSESLEDL
jgi:hypothetical protein